MNQNSSRGGSALTDGCRWVANIKTMDDKTAKKFQVTDPHNYVVLDVTKSNYAPKLPAPIYFRRGEVGRSPMLTWPPSGVRGSLIGFWTAWPKRKRLAAISHGGTCFTTRKRSTSLTIIKETVQGFNRVRDINMAVDHMLEAGWLKEDKVREAKTGPGKRSCG